MDDYRKYVIEFVRRHPIIWDPTHMDYKSRELRKQVWEAIDSKVKPPTGCTTYAKATWEHMSRSFSNALKRRDKRSRNGSDNDKEWRFEKDMMFLMPVKQLRYTSITGTMPDTKLDLDLDLDTSQDSPHSQIYMDNARDGDKVQPEVLPEVNNTTFSTGASCAGGGQRFENACTPKKRKQTYTDNNSECEDADDVVRHFNFKPRHNVVMADKSSDSVRLNFFISMMPIVDSLDDDQFMALQVDFIQAVQKHKNARQFPNT